jgi:hypothetical protein
VLPRPVLPNDHRSCAHKLAPLRGAGDKTLDFIQNSQVTLGLAQLKELAANPFSSSACRARPRIASQIDQFRGHLGFRQKPRAEPPQVMVQLKTPPQRTVNKQPAALGGGHHAA